MKVEEMKYEKQKHDTSVSMYLCAGYKGGFSFETYGCDCCSETIEFTKEELVGHVAELETALARAKKLLEDMGS